MEIEHIQKNGQNFVLIPEDDFCSIMENIEMQEDIAAFDRVKEDNEEAFPIELGEKLTQATHQGRSLLPIWREYRGMSQTELAEKSGIVQSYISAIESGKKPGSIDAMKALADTLNITLDDLV